MTPQLQVMYQTMLKPAVQLMTDDEYKEVRAFVLKEIATEDQRRNAVQTANG